MKKKIFYLSTTICDSVCLVDPFCRAKATTLRNGWRHGNGDGRRQWQLRWPMVTETAMADGKGDGDSNGWWRRDRDGGGNDQWWLQWQWLTATAMAMGDCGSTGDGDGDGNGFGNGNGDGDGDGNGDGHGKGDHYKGRVASSCDGIVQRFWRVGTLPPPPWTQRKVHASWGWHC